MRAEQHGSTLVVVLLLLTLMTATAVSIMQSAIAQTRLTGSLAASRQAFLSASYGVAAGMRISRENPAGLPAPGNITALPSADTGTLAELRHVAGPLACNDLAPVIGIRHDYEIRATGRGARGAVSHHRQGFYVCREDCGGLACTGVETQPQPTYWYVTRPDNP